MEYKLEKIISLIIVLFFMFFLFVKIGTAQDNAQFKKYADFLEKIKSQQIDVIQNKELALQTLAWLQEKINQDHTQKDKLHFNIGIIYSLLEENDLAIYHLLNSDLQRAQEKVDEILNRSETSYLHGFTLNETITLQFLTQKQIEYFIILSNILFWTLMTMMFFFKRKIKKVYFALLLFCICFSSFAYVEKNNHYFTQKKVITKQNKIIAYTGPGLSYDIQSLLSFSKGKVLFIQDQLNDWIQVSDNNQTGWIQVYDVILLNKHS